MSEFENMTRIKIEKSVELLCSLYRDNLITDAYIIGSVAKGTAKKESDIDILIINPDFELYLESLSPDENQENLKKIVDKLKNIGVQFKLIKKETFVTFEFWFQLYNGEIFHIMPQKYFFNSLPHIQIPRDMCS